MPSPIAHAAIGYVIYRVYRSRAPKRDQSWHKPVPGLLFFTVGLSLLPDVDIIPGILLGSFKQYHNNLSHSLFMGLLTALLAAGVLSFRGRSNFKMWFMIGALCYQAHIVIDYFTPGRGVFALWPFSTERFIAPFPLFYGLQWSDGLINISHLWTGLTELGFAAGLILITHLLRAHLLIRGES